MKTLLIAITLVYIVATALLINANRTLIQQRDKLLRLYEQSVDLNTQLINEKLREDSIFIQPSRITPHTPILD